MEVMGIIPARAGSVEIPNKNLKLLGEWPLVRWTLHTASESNLSSIVLSTDSDQIAAVAKPYERIQVVDQPSPMRDGKLNAVNVCLWYIYHLKENDLPVPEAVMMLLPTSPFRKYSDIDNTIERLDKGAKAVIGITDSKPIESLRVLDKGKLRPVHAVKRRNGLNIQRQEVDSIYSVNGAMFAALTETLLKHGTFHIEEATPLYMEPIRSIDINTEADLRLARSCLS